MESDICKYKEFSVILKNILNYGQDQHENPTSANGFKIYRTKSR